MMTDDKPMRSIHTDNLTCLASRAANTHKGQLRCILVTAGDVAKEGDGLFSAQAALHFGVFRLVAWRAWDGKRLTSQVRGGAASALCERIHLLFEEHSPCQA
jgi:hypothetical protein